MAWPRFCFCRAFVAEGPGPQPGALGGASWLTSRCPKSNGYRDQIRNVMQEMPHRALGTRDVACPEGTTDVQALMTSASREAGGHGFL